MEERRGVSSRPSSPKEVVGIVVFVLICAVALPIVLAAIALALSTVAGPPILVALNLFAGRWGGAALWAVIGCFLYWADYKILKWLSQRR